MAEEKVFFASGTILLEAALYVHPSATGGVVLCHPHPLYGGNMDDGVTVAIARELQVQGLATLRFNFRGVGKSSGSYSGGKGEERDAMEAVDFLANRLGGNCRFLGICGYSFGGMIALKVAARSPVVAAVAAVAPAIHLARSPIRCQKPKLFILGGKDQIIDLVAIKSLIQEMPEPKELCLFAEADHFFIGFKRRVAVVVRQFFAKQIVTHFPYS